MTFIFLFFRPSSGIWPGTYNSRRPPRFVSKIVTRSFPFLTSISEVLRWIEWCIQKWTNQQKWLQLLKRRNAHHLRPHLHDTQGQYFCSGKKYKSQLKPVEAWPLSGFCATGRRLSHRASLKPPSGTLATKRLLRHLVDLRLLGVFCSTGRI